MSAVQFWSGVACVKVKGAKDIWSLSPGKRPWTLEGVGCSDSICIKNPLCICDGYEPVSIKKHSVYSSGPYRCRAAHTVVERPIPLSKSMFKNVFQGPFKNSYFYTFKSGLNLSDHNLKRNIAKVFSPPACTCKLSKSVHACCVNQLSRCESILTWTKC